jgi:IS5 family transposase
MEIIPYQEELRPALPTVIGNVDYQEFRATLLRIEEILERSRVERKFIEERLDQSRRKAEQNKRVLGAKELAQVALHAARALRCNVVRLADSPLLQRFCGIGRLDVIQVPSKSTLDRYGRWVEEETVRKVVDELDRSAAAPGKRGRQPLGLARPLDLDAYFVDTTCVEANIHFPVDWVLLRDATRTLVKAIRVIRKHGLKHRMPEPADLLRQMNRLAIEMTQVARKRAESKKERKRVLRAMKALTQLIRRHAGRYRQMLATRWQETDLKEGHARQILGRIDGVVKQLPAAIAQAHERIIAELPVRNDQKILSLYEPDIHVIVRGKASGAVEFGNTLLLGEERNGVILDWRLLKEQAPSDNHLVGASLDRFTSLFGRPPGALVADRGFDDGDNRTRLSDEGIYNAITPKSPRKLAQRMTEERFAMLQRRRAQTEARVSILKNAFLGRPMRSKGFAHRETNIAWAVLAHNLWVIARLPTAVEQAQRQRKAA